MIQETIDEINLLLLESFSEEQKLKPIQLHGLAVAKYDQQAKAERLVLALEEKTPRLVLDNKTLWQSAHLLAGGDVASTVNYGSFNSNSYTASLMLIGCSKRASGLAQALAVLEQTSYIRVERFENNTIEVLNRYWRQPANDEKNYDPNWWAFAIQYRIQGISGTDFANFYNLFDEVTV
jgi:hypothetical protein